MDVRVNPIVVGVDYHPVLVEKSIIDNQLLLFGDMVVWSVMVSSTTLQYGVINAED